MRNKEGMNFNCIFEETLDYIDIDYTHLNKTVRYEKRPHGEWLTIKNRNGTVVALRCSACGQSPKYAIESDFCPRCGSDNRKKVNE